MKEDESLDELCIKQADDIIFLLRENEVLLAVADAAWECKRTTVPIPRDLAQKRIEALDQTLIAWHEFENDNG